MPEETTPENAEAGEPAKAEDSAETVTATDPKPAASSDPSKPVEGSASSTTPPASAEGEAPSEGLDPQLVALCVVLWLVAVGIFAFKFPDIRLDWYLGNIKEALDTNSGLSESDIKALVALDPERVVKKISAELADAQQTDQRYRGSLVRVLERVPGEQAFKALTACANDADPRVRANAYLALGSRGQKVESERESAFHTVLNRVRGEPEPNARGWACKVMGDFKDKRAAWPLIFVLAHAGGHPQTLVRVRALQALRAISGKSGEEIPFDVVAPIEERDAMMAKWEAWYTEDADGEIPPGESVTAYRKKSKDDFWNAQEPKEKDGTPWNMWNVVQQIDRSNTVPAESLAFLIKASKKDKIIPWTLQLVLRTRSGDGWLSVRRAVGAALRECLGATGDELPYDPAATEEVRYEQLQALEDAFVKWGGKIPPRSSLKIYRATELQARKLAEAAKKALDKSSPDKANQPQR